MAKNLTEIVPLGISRRDELDAFFGGNKAA